jgi:hypothetical protein
MPRTEHDIPCGMVIAAVGQTAASDELDSRGLMARDRVAADYAGMRTADAKVFAAGDGAFGGSTIVMAMNHGQRAAYYIKAFLDGIDEPMPYRTPYRTRRVPVAQDLMWERLPRHEQDFHGVGDDPVAFPEIESAYPIEVAKAEASRCYRCDAETGSTDYSVYHREDIFSMARTVPADMAKNRAMLQRRLAPRENPFPEDRPASLDDLVFLPANLSRLVIDPYREACRLSSTLAGGLAMAHPFFATGFDDAPAEVRGDVARGLAEAECGYIGTKRLGEEVPWLQLVRPGHDTPDAVAAAVIHMAGSPFAAPAASRALDGQLLGLAVSSPAALEAAIPYALEHGFDILLLDGSGDIVGSWPELRSAPDLNILREAVRVLRELNREEEIDLVYFGGVRSGTDAAKVLALGAVAVVLGVPVALAAGGEITAGHDMEFASDHNGEERVQGVVNIVKASGGEASMMARCTGKTDVQNLEPEDMRAITLATAAATAIPLVGKH